MYYFLILVFYVYFEVNLQLNSGFAVKATSTDYIQKQEVDHHPPVKIGKCCELDELLKDDKCIPINETKQTQVWKPELIYGDVITEKNKQKEEKLSTYKLIIGLPRCNNGEHQWHVYHSQKGSDRLSILPSGELRHYVVKSNDEEGLNRQRNNYFDDETPIETMHYDYPFGHYCADKAILGRDENVTTYAMVCVPGLTIRWTETDHLIKHIVDPIFHGLAIVSYLIVAIVYFILPQLRDLVGNSVTSMSVCLIVSQCASTVRIFNEYGNHVNFLIADLVMYISLMGAFFWLNALGYYVWSTFRVRNVFIRITDTKKYCYYSIYVWISTASIAATALFAHFTLESNKQELTVTTSGNAPPQETIGWLGLAVLFTAIGFTIIVDLCFALTTANTLKRMNTYGRIHYKMKYSFQMYVLIFIIMSLGWISLLLSRLQYDILIYCDIFINLIQAVLILYVCVFGQRRVTFLLGKTCNCCASVESIEGLDWGEEMTAINAGY